MVILSLIVKRTRVKTLVKDKRVALEAFGSYVEVGKVILQNHYQIASFNFMYLYSSPFVFSVIIAYMVLACAVNGRRYK